MSNPQKLKLILNEEERTINPFAPGDVRKDAKTIIHAAISYLTGKKGEIVLVDQREYPLHIVSNGGIGTVAFATPRYSDNSEGAPCGIYIPPWVRPHEVIDWVGPCYKYIKYWFNLPSLVPTSGGSRPDHKYFLKKITENASNYSIHPEQMGRIVNGRKWLVSQAIPYVSPPPEES